MKIWKLLVVPAILLSLAGTASADDIQVIFDPQAPQIGNFFLIQSVGVTYSVNWGSCTQAGVPTALQGDAGCLLFVNETGGNIDNLNLTFTVNSALVGQTINCMSLDAALSSNNCADAGTLSLGQMVSVNFFGGSSISNFMAFFLAENGVDPNNLPPLGVTVPAYDPGTLLLLATGIAFLALAGLRRAA